MERAVHGLRAAETPKLSNRSRKRKADDSAVVAVVTKRQRERRPTKEETFLDELLASLSGSELEGETRGEKMGEEE